MLSLELCYAMETLPGMEIHLELMEINLTLAGAGQFSHLNISKAFYGLGFMSLSSFIFELQPFEKRRAKS